MDRSRFLDRHQILQLERIILTRMNDEKGSVTVTDLMWVKFRNAANIVNKELSDRTDDAELRLQYREFLR